LSGASLAEARLGGANLRVADLSGTNLFVTFLAGADLTGADLSGAALGNRLDGSILTGVTWSATRCPDGTHSDTNASSPESCCANMGTAAPAACSP
jgi:uncharacterized protein YjbI with pentapeptide repeats